MLWPLGTRWRSIEFPDRGSDANLDEVKGEEFFPPSSTTAVCRFVYQAYTSDGEISRFNKFTRGNTS